MDTKQNLAVFEAEFMKKSSNVGAKLKKSVAYKKAYVSTWIEIENIICSMFIRHDL